MTPLPVEATTPLLFNDLGSIPCSEFELLAGDRVLFYTDGITDRENADGEPYAVERLTSALNQARAFLPAVAVERLVDDIDLFAGVHEPEDDQTLLLVGFH